MTSRVPDVHRQQLPARVVKTDRREARRARAGEEAGLLWGKTGAKDCFWLGNRAPRVFAGELARLWLRVETRLLDACLQAEA